MIHFVPSLFCIVVRLQNFTDTATHSDKRDPEKPISAGFYRLEKGTPLVYTYHYEEMKIILEGEFEIADETGQKVTATPGDVFYFPKGSTITFTTPSYGLAFYVSVSLSRGSRSFHGTRGGDGSGREGVSMVRSTWGPG